MILAAGIAAAVTGVVHAQADAPAYGPSGYPALITTPTARMPVSGTIGVGLSIAPPYNTLYLAAQPTEWLHVGAKYVAITNRRYSDVNDQSFKDKSFDIAVRLLEESEWLPAVVAGLNDFGGTGLFSSEYLVATRSYWDWSVTLGLGFGRLGTYGDLRNPLAAILPSADDRVLEADPDERGGVPEVEDWFGGRRVSIIGGVEWAPRYRNWSVQLELDGNDYSADPSTERLDVRSRINFGLRYRLPGSWFASLAYVRGDTVIGQIGVAPRVGRDESRIAKSGLPAAKHLRNEAYRADVKPLDTTEGMAQWSDDLAARGIFARAANIDPDTQTLSLWQSNTASDESIDVLRIVGRSALGRLPKDVRKVEVIEVSGGLDALSLTADRDDLDAEARGASVDELRAAVEIRSLPETPRDQAQYQDFVRHPSWVWGVSPALRSNIGGIDGFYFGQLLLKPYVTLQTTPRLSFSAVGAVSLISNLDELQQRDSSQLPNVRSRLELYQSTGDDYYLDRLEGNYLFPLARDWFGRFSAGIFEEMFGGVAAEVLYRPLFSRFAFGVNVNYVRQRDYDQRFSFLDYEVATGHFTVYYDTPLNGVILKTSFGRYLARDVGVTVDIARAFRNGVELGAFATKTNVSSEEFGEGSFDKGIYIRIPLSVIYPGANKGRVDFDYRFLTRDGGQKVRDGRGLYGAVGNFNAGKIYEN